MPGSSRIGGVVVAADTLDAAELVESARRLEDLGYECLWLPDVFGREIYVTAGHILANTTRLKVATGIAHVYGRDALSTLQAARTLSELSDGRFLLGLGVSNPMAAELHGVAWGKPVARMRRFLQAMSSAKVRVRTPVPAAPVLLAAHGPKMLQVAAELADGANTYLMPAEHTRHARPILGADKRLNVVLPCCLAGDAATGRAAGRRALSLYLPLDVYRERWSEFGFSAEDFDNGGSDRLIDAFFASGDEKTLRARIAEHVQAGADEVILLPHPADPTTGPIAWDLLEQLAPT